MANGGVSTTSQGPIPAGKGKSGFKNGGDYFILDAQNAVGLELKIEQLEAEKQQYIKLLAMTLDCEDNHCDHCKEDIQKALEGK